MNKAQNGSTVRVHYTGKLDDGMSQGEQSFVVNVAEIQDKHVTLDANHPLAGRDLTFELELVETE